MHQRCESCRTQHDKDVRLKGDSEDTKYDHFRQFYAIDFALNTPSAANTISREVLSSTASPTIPEEDDPWARTALLSLDGGGIRGLCSLLVLERIMDSIRRYEQEQDQEATSSAYSPLFNSTVHEDDRSSVEDGVKKDSSEYLPCHYFDLIGGTSTGGLIAIMLGRLRLSVQEAIQQYQNLAQHVFEKPSSRLKRIFIKYNAASRRSNLQRHFDVLADRRRFQSDPARCKTVVCAIEKISHAKQKTVHLSPHLIRSYFARVLHEEKDNNLRISEVARASTAAPSFSKSERINDRRYYDAIVSNLMNPSWVLYGEVCHRIGESLDLLLSLGGGEVNNKNAGRESQGSESLSDQVTYSKWVDDKVRSESEVHDFRYFRLDVESVLEDVRLDEWKPRSDGTLTRQRIKEASDLYLQRTAVDCDVIARALVEKRIQRANTMRWESFAHGIYYVCPIMDCQIDNHFLHRNALMDHLIEKHREAPPDSLHYKEFMRLLDKGRRTTSDSG